MKNLKITLDGAVTALFVIGAIIAAIGFVWWVGILIAWAFSVAIALGLLAVGLLLMLVAFVVSLVTSKSEE